MEKKVVEVKDWGLNPRQKKFCKLYASDEEFFGNGVQSYIESYKPKKIGNWYLTARSNASQLLTNTNVLGHINELLELQGLNDAFVDKQLEFLITQHADFKSKLGAVHEYNQLKRRVEAGGNKTLVLVVTGQSAKRYGQSGSS